MIIIKIFICLPITDIRDNGMVVVGLDEFGRFGEHGDVFVDDIVVDDCRVKKIKF